MNKFFTLLFILAIGVGSCSKKEESPNPVQKNQNNSSSTGGTGGGTGGGGGGTGGGTGGGGTGGSTTPPTLTINSDPQFWGIVNGKVVHIISGIDGNTYEVSNSPTLNEWECFIGKFPNRPFFGIIKVEDNQPMNYKPTDAQFLSYFTPGKHRIQEDDNALNWIMNYHEAGDEYDTDITIANITEEIEIIDMKQDTDPVSGKLRVKCLIKFTAYFDYNLAVDIKVTDAWVVAYFINY